MRRYSLFLCIILSSALSAQRTHIGIFGGLAAYNGDLTDKIFPKKVTNGSIGVTVNYELREKIMLRGGFTYAVVGGADRFSDNTEALKRNLSFETSIAEFSVVGEYYLNNLNERRYSPYGFIGLAIYHFNPYAYNGTDNKIYLQPLTTEGQGLPGYGTKPYQLTQLAIPFGGGLKFVINDKFRVGAEVAFRKLFTDHLDDVSSFYADPTDLLAGRGQLSVDMSYRGDELTNGDPVYPPKSIQRGNEKVKDWYYFAGIHLTYRLGSNKSGGFNGGSKGRANGCPSVPL